MVAALRFRSPDREGLVQLSARDWGKALAFSARTLLTLPLGFTWPGSFPEAGRHTVERALRNTAQRWQRVRAQYLEVADLLAEEQLEFLVMKGFSQAPRFAADPRHRFQGDIDLLLRPEQVRQAGQAVLRLNYESLNPFDAHPIDHLPTLIRKTGWRWRGDDFDVEIPISLELHFRVWSESTERFAPRGLECFWERRESRELDGFRFPTFHPADAVAIACLHLLRHLLRGSVVPYQVYELAWMLDRSAADTSFWNGWHELHHESLRRLEVISLAVAANWFDCHLSDPVRSEIERLPSDVKCWLDTCSESPLAGLFHPNKDELWLHWSLLESPRDRLSVLRRRLLPQQLPGAVDAVHVPREQLTWRIRLVSRWRYVTFLSGRILHHLQSLPGTAWSALGWFGAGLGLSEQFWRFFLAEGCFDFGMFVFVFLYNLYLVQLGFRENFLGFVSGAMGAGSLAGTILSVLVMQRFGIRRTLLAAFALTAVLSILRAYLTFPAALISLAALTGLTASAWPVAYAPAIAHLTTDRGRPIGFSLICSAGIAIGVLGSQSASRLPGWLLRLHLASSDVESYRLALFAGCAFVLLALWPLSRVRIAAAPPPERKLHRPSPVLLRFLIAMAVWNLGTGAMNSFFNVFFARHVQMPVEQIGTVFSAAQMAQVGAILLSPIVFRRFGLTRGISGMQFATACSLGILAVVHGSIWPALGYIGYMMSQYSSEPGQFTLLMDSVPAADRNSASALNFLVTFSGQAVAAVVAGAMLSRFGYPPVLVTSAIICAGAALLLRILFAKRKPEPQSDP